MRMRKVEPISLHALNQELIQVRVELLDTQRQLDQARLDAARCEEALHEAQRTHTRCEQRLQAKLVTVRVEERARMWAEWGKPFPAVLRLRAEVFHAVVEEIGVQPWLAGEPMHPPFSTPEPITAWQTPFGDLCIEVGDWDQDMEIVEDSEMVDS